MSRLEIDVVAAMIWDGGRFMICQRPASKIRPLEWEFPGGKIEQGESKQEALIRECQEELGIVLVVQNEIAETVYEYDEFIVRLTLLGATILEGAPQLLEHNALRWITIEELPGYVFCAADESLLKQIVEKFVLSRGGRR